MEAEVQPAPKKHKDLLPVGEAEAWGSRKITLESAEKWGFTRSEMGGQVARLFNYRDLNGNIVAQKVRLKGKEFRFLGDTKKAGLYGMHLFRDGGKKVVIVEGEVDAISLSQIQNHRWPVVSVPNGAQGARKALQANLEWLNKFDEVVLMFDMDEYGRDAVEDCQGLFAPGTCKIAKLPLKDANEMLMAGREKELLDAVWEAKVYRPDGIVSGTELFDMVMTEEVIFSVPYVFQGLQDKLQGQRRGELVTWTAGSGIGKSAVIREVTHANLQAGERVGIMMLEESTRRTALGMMGLALNKPLHLSREGVTDEEMKDAFDRTLGTGNVFLYDHFGSTQVDNLLNRIRYLAKGCDCSRIVLDHLSIIISGQEDGDERRMIDNTMTALKTLAMECNVGIDLISHLKRPGGDKGHENGAETSLAQLRGSHSIAQLSDAVIGLERNQQDADRSHITTLRVLKNRWTGETGVAGWLAYDRETGRLHELLDDPFETSEGETPFGNETDGDF